jgi:exopolysaccharide production protein ExoQ
VTPLSATSILGRRSRLWRMVDHDHIGLAAEAAIDPPGQIYRISSVHGLVLPWVMLISLIFMATGGVLSFESTMVNSYPNLGSLAGLTETRNFGILGRIVFPGLSYSIILWLVYTRLDSVLSVAFRMKAMTALALLAVLSAAWSQDPFRSLYNGFFYLISTFFAYYLVVKFGPKRIMDLLMMTGAAIAIIDLLVVIFLPEYGIISADARKYGSWRGIFLMRTGASTCLTFLITPALVFGYRRFTFWRCAYIALLGLSIVKANAASALVDIFCYTAFMAGLNYLRRFERKSALFLFLVLSAALAAAVAIGQAHFDEIVTFLNRDPTLTGRTVIWDALIPTIGSHPWLGYGFYAFWLGMRGESGRIILATNWFFGYAHDGYLEIILQLGLVGFAVFLVTLFQAIKNAVAVIRTRSAGVDWLIGLLFLTLLFNLDEESFAWPNSLLSILYIVTCTGLAMAAKQARSSSLIYSSTHANHLSFTS